MKVVEFQSIYGVRIVIVKSDVNIVSVDCIVGVLHDSLL